MTSQDARRALEAYWASVSTYRPKEERNAHPEGMQVISPHILFDPRIDLVSARVRERAHAVENVVQTLERGHLDIPDEDKFKFRQKHDAQSSFDLPTAMGHRADKAARLSALKVYDCHPDYHGGMIWNARR